MFKINSIFLLCFGVIISTHYLISAEKCNIKQCRSYCSWKAAGGMDENGFTILDDLMPILSGLFDREQKYGSTVESFVKSAVEACTGKAKVMKEHHENPPKCFELNFLVECFVKFMKVR